MTASTTLRSAIGIVGDVPLVLFVGHNFERKGIGGCNRSLGRLDGPSRLTVVGGGDAGSYSKLALHLGARDRVHFIGATETPEGCFRTPISSSCPHTRTSGYTVVEAMAAGATGRDYGRRRCQLARGGDGSGLVVPAGSVRSLREAVARVLGDPTLRQEMPASGEAAAARYGLEAFGERMLAHYERARRTAVRRRD